MTGLLVALALAGVGGPAQGQLLNSATNGTIYYGDDRTPAPNETGSLFEAVGALEVSTGAQGRGLLRATAFLIGQCHAMTARHNILGYVQTGRRGSLIFRTGDGAGIAATIDAMGQNPGFGDDWAILKLETCIGRRLQPVMFDLRPPARVVELRGREEGQLLMVGFPLGVARSTPVMDPGCKAHGIHRADFTFAHDCTGGAGMSGAPIFRAGALGELLVVGMHTAAPFAALDQDQTVPTFHPLLLSKAIPTAPLAAALKANRLPGLRVSGIARADELRRVTDDVSMARFQEMIWQLAERQDLTARLYLCAMLPNRSSGTPEPDNPNCQGLAPFFEQRPQQVLNNPLLAYYVGVIYFYGLHGQPPDFGSAKRLMLAARQGGVPQAGVFLGVLAEAGTQTIDPEPQTALREFAFAAKGGVVEGTYQIAQLYHRAGDVAKARAQYQQAARQGHPVAQEALERLALDLQDNGRLDLLPSPSEMPRLP